MGREATLPQRLGIDFRDVLVAMHHKDLFRLGLKGADPSQQAVPVGMGGEPLEVDDAGLHGDLFPKELDRLHPIQQPAAQSPLALIAHKDYGALSSPQVVLEMVPDPSGIAHAGGRDDDLWGPVQVQILGLLAGLRNIESREPEERPAPQSLNGLLIQIAMQVPGENLSGLTGQRRVHIDGEIRN